MSDPAMQEMPVPATVRQVFDAMMVRRLWASTPTDRSEWARSIRGLIRDFFDESCVADAGTALIGGDGAVDRYSDLLEFATMLFAQGIELGDPAQVEDAVRIAAGLACLVAAGGAPSEPAEAVA